MSDTGGNGAAFTLTEASKLCRRQNPSGQWSSVSRKTLARTLDQDKFPGAYRADGPAGEGSGPWMIPKADLLAEGFIPGGGRAEAEPDEVSKLETAEDGATDRWRELRLAASISDLETLRAEVAELRRRAEVAEAVAEERGKALEDTRLALRALTAGTPEKTPSDSPPAASPASSGGSRTRRLLHRLRRR